MGRKSACQTGSDQRDVGGGVQRRRHEFLRHLRTEHIRRQRLQHLELQVQKHNPMNKRNTCLAQVDSLMRVFQLIKINLSFSVTIEEGNV